MPHTSIRRSISRALPVGALALLLVAELAVPAEAAIIRKGHIRKSASGPYRTHYLVAEDPDGTVDTISVTLEAVKGPIPLENPITLTFDAFDDATGEASFVHEGLEFTGDAVGWTYAVTATMLNVDGKPVGEPVQLFLTVEPPAAPKPDVVYTDLPDGDLTLDGVYAVLRGVDFRGNITAHNATVVIEGGSRIEGDIQTDDGSILEIVGSSTVKGDIAVDDGGGVFLDGSTVEGNIRVTGGQGSVVATGNTVTENLRLTAVGGSLDVSNNTVGGNIRAKSNQGNLTLTGNTLEGNLKSEANRGELVMTGNTVTGNLKSSGDRGDSWIKGNTVAGNLDFKDNGGGLSVSSGTVGGNVSAKGSGSVTVTGVTIGGNLKIQGATSCSQSNNTVSGNISGC